ncbi:MAG: SPOR domain-containing protein [Gemmatimonadetes bacterium]|nr:SPOR domain-containing protein [Gemmatimonadota bacterium]
MALRVPAGGGTVHAYRLPALTEISGAVRGRLPAVDRVLGLDPESQLLFLRTEKKEVLAFDLESGRVDTVATGVQQATLGPDGTLFTVDAQRRVISLKRRVRFAWPQALGGIPRDLFGAGDQRLVAVVTQNPPRLITAGADQPPASRAIALSGDVAASFWGDLIAVAGDSGVTILDPLRPRDSSFVPIADHPRALLFSPAGHRIYVARRSGLGLAVIDRFERQEIDGVALPAPAATMRIDPHGRWLLARPAVGDTAWVVDLPVKSLRGAAATAWQVDLPAVAPDGSLLLRQGDDIVAVRPDSLRETGRVTGGATDVWVTTPWLPRGMARGPALVEAPAPSVAAAADSMGPEGPLYVQVSVSQNQAWSADNAEQLARAGLPAKVLPSATPDEGYRVVLGPYSTRAQAEAIGRKLGRPFWIYQPPSTQPQ